MAGVICDGGVVFVFESAKDREAIHYLIDFFGHFVALLEN